jgi:tRNA wybutosine-synthesizing protein 2
MSRRSLPDLILDSINVPEGKHTFLPRGFQRIGHIVLLSLRPEVLDYSEAIAAAVLDNYSYVKSVYLAEGISGELRQPRVHYLAGEKRTETVHKENGCRFMLDVSRVMLSKGNLSERARLPPLVRDGEVVADLFAGIGYFCIAIARHSRPRHVYAIEKNPQAFHYLRENITLNRVQHRVRPILGDCREVRLGGAADRVIMGYLPKTREFLPAAFSALKPSGGVIHYHDTFREGELWEKPIENLESAAFRAGFALERVLHKANVKDYAPGVFHIVIDAQFRKK